MLAPLALDRNSYVPPTWSSGWGKSKANLVSFATRCWQSRQKPTLPSRVYKTRCQLARQCAHLDIVLQQVEANQAAQGDPSRDDSDARERLLQRSQLVDEAALWRKSGPQRPWILRVRIPHVLGDSPAGIQAFVRESINVTARVVAQLRSISDFDVTQSVPVRTGSPRVVSWSPTASSSCVRRSPGCLLSVRLLPSLDADRPCLERLAPLSAAFSTASAHLRTHTLCNYASLSSAKARTVMCEMVNHDLRLWANDLMRFALTSQPPVVPPPPDTAFAVPPLPKRRF